MRKNTQIALIDVGSLKITAIVAEKGVNGTYLFKGRFEYPYDGFMDKEFLDKEGLFSLLKRAVDDIKRTINVKIFPIYVGVPGAFTNVIVKESQISFQKKKKIRQEDVNDLFEASFVAKSNKETLINRSAVFYEIDDGRKLASPIGSFSSILKGTLSFISCDNYFINAFNVLNEDKCVSKVEFISVPLAESMYLIDAETRDRIAIILDVGHIISSFALIQGDGILYEKDFAYGGGFITAALVEKFGIEDFETAEKLKRKVNLSSKKSVGAFDLIDADNGDYYDAEKTKEVIFYNLDGLCETISDAMEDSKYVIPDYVPIFLTGGGISYLRGAKEHIAVRLGMSVNIITPKIPLMEMPTESSLISLVNLIFEQNK